MMASLRAHRWAIVFALAAAFTFASFASTAAPPDIRTIIQQSVAANARDLKAQDDYAFDERHVKSKVEANGEVKPQGSKTSEVLMIDGSPYRRLLAVNDERLTSEQQAEEQSKLRHEIERRHSESAHDRKARVDKYQAQEAEEHLLMEQMATAFKFTLLGEEDVNGVACYHLKATPDPNYNPPVEKARVLKGMCGEMWVDKQAYHWVKVQSDVIEPVTFGFFVAKVNPGTRFELDQCLFGGVWLPKHFIQSVNASVLGLYGIRNQDEFFYSNYQENASQLKVHAALH